MFQSYAGINDGALPSRLRGYRRSDDSIGCAIGIGGDDAEAITRPILEPSKGNR